ncbi:P-loop containing nucleoside triphosphate hydrolase [Sesbania bispinosa]|nr:P-loop containing nucleoside triphosphate hydrolase [Sesbania bispinosa]
MVVAISSSSYWMVAPWILKAKPLTLKRLTTLKFKCCKASPQPHCSILPSDLHHTLLNQPNRPQLLEVILDLGRFPEARYLGKDGSQCLRNTEVTVKELEYAQQAVGEFGRDNRAGIEGTLHRISAIRSRNGGIVGLTCRVGRAVSGHIDMVYDLLQYGRSILFVGRPGVGKTTVMREIARVLSDEFHKRVVIVDTSNEIGGDGNIPHAAIGGARRLQVPEPSMQHSIMIEAVENHTPEVIIVDEIGTEAEAHACRSIAERGVMLIGTAHGQQLDNIMKNPTLSDLIGGIESVTLGDAEARARNCQKTILERKAPPTFDFLIEMRDRHYWLTHQTDKSVDMLLRGRSPQVENLRFAEPLIPKPIAIVLPESLEQLQNSIACCREGSLEIRVRCGGHSYEGTSSVADDGTLFVIIDMMNLNHVWVDMETETAWVEGGATLGETYYAISQASDVHGFSAGSCPTVGVGGHIGGGGFGLLSRKYGLAADNVVDALLVDANGQLLNRETMGEDVFWAIRGGGGGLWGIVYAWKIQLVHKWQYVAPNLEDDFYLSCFVGAGLPEAKTIGLSATFKGLYLGPRASAISILNKAFPELGIEEEECREMSWIESIVFFSGLSDGASISDLKNRYFQDKEYFKAKSDFVKNNVSLLGIETALDILEKEPKGYVILDPYGGMMHNISSESIAFPHRSGNLFTIQYLVYWKETDNDKSSDYIDWIRGFYASMTPFVSWGPRAAYINYMDFDLGVMEQIRNGANMKDAVDNARVWGEKYFLSNYDRLVRAKTLIDPNNVFTNEQGIPPMSFASPNAKALSTS